MRRRYIYPVGGYGPRAPKTRYGNRRAPKRKGRNYGLYKRIKPYLDNQLEHKYVLSDGTLNPTSASLNKILVNGLIKGTDRDTRVGNQITMKAFDYKAIWSINVSNTYSNIRVMLVFDKQTNDSAFGDTDLLHLAKVKGLWNYNNAERFQVIADFTLDVNQEGNESQHIAIHKKLNHKVEYNNANNGTVADIDRGSLYLVHLSDQAIDLPLVDYEWRLIYTDA